ncbi:MAG: hypothetical protein Q8N53_00795 [Longimicrobiales bacterium]|nr:hypothetical protein [Longimicrobiales bacterium]
MDGSVAFAGLTRDLQALFLGGVDTPLDPAAFDALALRVFAVQYEANRVYSGFCERRGATPGTVTRWEDVPAVPTTAFRFVDLVCGEPSAAEATYLTSGTTAGSRARGRHHVPRVALYRASALPNLRAHLVPEDRPLPLLSLVPPPSEAPSSSLSAMVGFLADAWGNPVRWLGHPERGPDVDGFRGAAAEAAASSLPVLITGTAFAFVHLLESLAGAGCALAFPEGSRLMETGGFKGRSRAVGRDELYGALEHRLGIPRSRMVNEYGMTELLSQLYEPVLREGLQAAGRHVPPPWLKVRALDPTTLVPLGPGETGLLAFFDLANAGSVSHVLTEDLGSVSPDGVRLLGRSPGAEPRGCSLALEEILSATGFAS